MNIRFCLSDFLYDKQNFIALYEDKIYIYHYLELLNLEKNIIVLKIADYKLKITGEDFTINKLSKDEILITGKINNIGKIYE